MQYAPIVPVGMLPEISSYRYHLVLAHLLLTDPHYRNHYKNQKGHLILDNGAAEGELIKDTDKLLELAHEIHAAEVTAPDVLADTDETLKLLKRFVKEQETPVFNTLVVLQCRTWADFDKMFWEAIQYADSLALPKIMCEHLGPYARIEAADRIRNKFQHYTIPIHAFGCTDWLREAYWISRQGIIRGIDSAAPIVSAMYGESCWQKSRRRPQWYFSASPAKYARSRVKENMDEFESWCTSTSVSEMRGVWPQQ